MGDSLMAGTFGERFYYCVGIVADINLSFCHKLLPPLLISIIDKLILQHLQCAIILLHIIY